MVDQPETPKGPVLQCARCGNEFRADKGPLLYCHQCIWHMNQTTKPVPQQTKKRISPPKGEK